MNPARDPVEVLVIGGGIIGCTLARAAAAAGMSVALVEPREPGMEATWAAAGMLSPLGEAEAPSPFLELALTSLQLYASFVQEVEAAASRPVGFLECGKLEVALCPEEEEELRQRFEWMEERDLPARWLSGPSVRKREPAVTEAAKCGLLFHSEGQVDNRLLGPAVAAAARAEGVELHSGSAARRLETQNGRVTGAWLADGSLIEAARVVVAAGAWSGDLENLPRRLPVRPVRGQMVALRPGRLGLSTIIQSSGAYLIPRRGGPVIAGATMEDAGFSKGTTAEGIASLLDGAMATVPELAAAPLLEVWSGLRPGTPDGWPILGEDPDVGGLFYATGHFRNGILLAPVTAACLLPLLTGTGVPPVDLKPFRPDRFGTSAPSDG